MRFTLDAADRIVAFDEPFRAFSRELGVGDPTHLRFLDLLPQRLRETCAPLPETARAEGQAHAVFTFAGAHSRNYRLEMSAGAEGELHGRVIDLAGTSVPPADRGDERYAVLVDNATELCAVFDQRLALVAFNVPFAASVEFLTGRPAHLGDDFEQVFDPEARPRLRALADRALAGEAQLTDVELTLRGMQRTYELSLNPVREGGKVVAAVCIARNVTDRRMEAAARSAILEAIPDAIAVLRRDGLVLDYYPSTEVPLHLGRDQIVGRMLESFTFLDVPTMQRHLARTFETRATELIEYEVEIDGELRRRESRLRAISDDEAIFIVRDVTDARRLMSRMVTTDRMAALGTMAAGVAHELNNPLAFVSANLELLASQLAGARAAHQAVTVAQEGIARMAAIVRDLTAFARPEEDRAVVEVGVAIDFALRMTRSALSGVARVERRGEADARVCIDESRLGQVLVNLIVNAAQAFDPDRDPAKNLVSLDISRDAERVFLAVSDNGVGMTPETAARIFDPFFTTKPPGVGTGLGLWVVQGIVRGAGGDIEVESTLGLGTTFRVILPLSREPPKVTRIGTRSHRRRVLLVDDDPMVLESLARMLELVHDVVAVPGGASAIEAADDRFDVVLCDLTMPGIDGLEVLEELARRGQKGQLVLMTGAPIDDRLRAHLQRISARILPKPFKLADLDALIG